MIDALYCRSTAVLLAMHVWLYVVAVLYMVSGAGRPRSVAACCSAIRSAAAGALTIASHALYLYYSIRRIAARGINI